MAGMEIFGLAETLADIQRLKTMFGGSPGDGNVVFLVGTNVEYAVYVEMGTSVMEAQPYLRPAVREVADNPEKHVSTPVQSVDQMVREIALAIERKATQKAPVDTGNLQGSIRAQRVS